MIGAALKPRRRLQLLPLSDLLGGLSGGLTSLATNLPVGIIALAPLGAAASSAGVLSTMFAAAAGAGLFSLLNSTRGLHCGVSTAYALILAPALAQLVRSGVLDTGAAAVPVALVTVGLRTLLVALCQAGLTLSGVGRLVPLIPYPVLSGIRNSAALLMVVVQFRPLVGLSPAGAEGLVWEHPGALLVSLVTAGLVVRPIKRLRSVPPVVVGMLAGSAVYYAAVASGGGWLVGPVLAEPTSGLQQLVVFGEGIRMLPTLPLGVLLVALMPAALSIALLSLMDTLAGAAVMQDRTGEHASARGDLVAVCAANVAAGVVGGLPLSGSVLGSLYVWDGGGRTAAAGAVRTVVMLAGAMLLSPVIGSLPVAVVAGMVTGAAWRVVDREPIGLARKVAHGRVHHRSEMLFNLLVMLCVPAVAVSFGMVPAVFLGTVLSICLFVVTMAGGVVRRRYRSPIGLSRTQRSERDTELMLQHGGEIEVIELHGALFFGSADQVAGEVRAALKAGVRYLILDFKRVSRVDLSGARRLVQVASGLWRDEIYVTFASVQKSRPVLDYFEDLGLTGRLRSDRVFTTLEQAVEHAEDALLAAHGAWSAVSAPEEVLRRIGIPEAAVAELLKRVKAHEFPAGTRVITAGDDSDVIYVLLEGRAEILLPIKTGEGRVRIATVNAGTLFGEMALLSGAPRSADVVALTPMRCLSLTTAAIASLRESEPDLAYHVMAAIAAQGVRNLRVANVALIAYED